MEKVNNTLYILKLHYFPHLLVLCIHTKHIDILQPFSLKPHTNTNTFAHYFFLPGVTTHTFLKESSIPTTNYKVSNT
jgi:hypothetical protein